jgi:hypothetical protein
MSRQLQRRHRWRRWGNGSCVASAALSFLGIVRDGIVRDAVPLNQLLELLTFDGMPLPDEDLIVVINVNLGIPGQAIAAGTDLIGIPMLIEGRQVYAADWSIVSCMPTSPIEFHDWEAYAMSIATEMRALTLTR